MSYDPACADLALHFLDGVAGTNERDIAALAQTIQSAIEDWLSDFEDNFEPRPNRESPT
ncbi:MAG: hypothetical protein AAAC47_27620 [Pararhizobium sp.]